MTRSISRSSDGSGGGGGGGGDHHDRPEPQILRAAEHDDVVALQATVANVRARGGGDHHAERLNTLLRIGLMRSAEKGRIQATRYLLSLGASPDGSPDRTRASPLLRAVERNHISVVQLLLAAGADVEAADKKGRTALMTAAWKNHYHILTALLARGADVDARDLRGRNVLHNLAADRQLDWGDSVVDLLRRHDVLLEGRDELRRTPLHWACATGKLRLAKQLLTPARPGAASAHIDAADSREKTALHLAAAHDHRDDIVALLLELGADVHARSDGGWQPLHNAAERGSLTTVRCLLQAGADINAKLLNGMTPLHLSSQGGHIEVVKCLLERSDLRRAVRDAFGSTPFLRAAQSRHKAILELLAPFNNEKALSEDALGACKGFQSVIVDFGNFKNENRVTKKSVYDLLYARDPVNPRKPANPILAKDKAVKFRWIHLPANTTAWVETLLTKVFIEEGASDIEGFKALENSFSHNHTGQRLHSHFMRPVCQSTPRAQPVPLPEDSALAGMGLSPETSVTPTIVVNGHAQGKANGALSKTPSPSGLSSPDTRPSTARGGGGNPTNGKENKHRESDKERGKRGGGGGRGKGAASPGTPNKDHRRPTEATHRRVPSSPGRKEPMPPAKGNIFAYMPYLHFETHRRHLEMQEAIQRAESLRTLRHRAATTCDEMLIRAHFSSSNVSLHVRRTLDQSFYHNIDTRLRDQDQVVYRYQCQGRPAAEMDPKIVMVDQLWMWILGKDLLITAFPQRWQQPKNDPLNVLDSIIEEVNSKTRHPVNDVYDLAMTITATCTSVLDRHRLGDEYQFLDMFESSIGNATDKETVLFKQFNTASMQASAWLQRHRRANTLAKMGAVAPLGEAAERDLKSKYEEWRQGPLFVDKLLDIGQETDLLAETKDIRDELNMMAKVLEDQKSVLPDLADAISDIFREEQRSLTDVRRRFRDQLKTIETHTKDIERMDKQAERIYYSTTDILDLKQKHANAFEARFGRDQAEGSAKQSRILIIFTIVTIIFLPLSFIAAFFTINIAEYPQVNGTNQLPIRFVLKYMIGISFAISVPFIMLALNLDRITSAFQAFKRQWRKHNGGQSSSSSSTHLGAGGSDTSMHESGGPAANVWSLAIEETLSAARKSEQRERHSPYLEPIRTRDSTNPDGAAAAAKHRVRTTAYRLRPSGDIERGGV